MFPEEPVAPDDPVRSLEGMLLSAHRTGGMPEALFDIGEQAVADIELVLRGLPADGLPPRPARDRDPDALEARRHDLTRTGRPVGVGQTGSLAVLLKRHPRGRLWLKVGTNTHVC